MNDKKSSPVGQIAGKALERHFDLFNTLIEFSKLFSYKNGDDRSIVIIGATFLDTLLEHILLGFFPENEKDVESLLKYDQPLGTYGSKVKMAYCLGLIEKKVKNDLVIIGKIRNKFAHDLFASFEDENIKSWCKQLKWHEISMMMSAPNEATARDIYQVGVNQLITNLNGVVGFARGEKRIILNNF